MPNPVYKVGDKVQLRFGGGWAGLNWIGWKSFGMKDTNEFVTVTQTRGDQVWVKLDSGHETYIGVTDIRNDPRVDWLACVPGPGGH